MTERFNQTLCERFRKHAEANPRDWGVKWLPYVLMCYPRRVHSVTGYSPFQIMFGRQMNHFKDWRSLDNEAEHVALRFRAEEIQKLINLVQTAALHAIKEHHPDSAFLQTRTTIYLKAEGLLNKLEVIALSHVIEVPIQFMVKIKKVTIKSKIH